MPNRFLELEKSLTGKRGGARANALTTRSFGRPWTFARSARIPGDTLERTKRFEGSINHLYLDTVGAVTVGVGHMLPDAANAATLAFARNVDGSAATEKEIKDEFALIKGKQKGMVASFYKQFTALHLLQSTIDDVLTADLERVVVGLRGKLPDYDTYPVKAQEALIDMAFNLGLHGLMAKFPKFIGHVKKQEWKAAAGESKRQGISDTRNEEIRNLLIDAATAASAP